MVMLVAIGVRFVAEELERPQRGGGEVERRLRMAAASERVERPDHARGADVEVLERRARPPAVPLVRGPERRCIERRIGVRDDHGDRLSNASRIPRLVGQWLELRRLIQHFGAHYFLLVDPDVSCRHRSASAARPRAHPVRPGTKMGSTRPGTPQPESIQLHARGLRHRRKQNLRLSCETCGCLRQSPARSPPAERSYSSPAVAFSARRGRPTARHDLERWGGGRDVGQWLFTDATDRVLLARLDQNERAWSHLKALVFHGHPAPASDNHVRLHTARMIMARLLRAGRSFYPRHG